MARTGSRTPAKRPVAPAKRPAGLPTRTGARGNPLGFFKDIASELRKVTWPTQEQTRNLTVIVLIVSAAIGLFLGLSDLIFSGLIRALLGF